MSKAPPRLHFDDGSRIITENTDAVPKSHHEADTLELTSSVTFSPRGSTQIDTYYEIDRIASEILEILP